jgi:hypothetical protein
MSIAGQFPLGNGTMDNLGMFNEGVLDKRSSYIIHWNYLKWKLGSWEKPNKTKRGKKKGPKLRLEIGVKIFANTVWQSGQIWREEIHELAIFK